MPYRVEKRQGKFSSLLVVAMALAACGPSAAEPTSGSETAETVGEVVTVYDVQGYMDGSDITEGTYIPRGATLTTDDTGIMQFIVMRADAECQLYTESGVVITDDDTRLMRHEAGDMMCEVPPGRGDNMVVEEFGRVLRTAPAEGGTFRVGVNPKGAGVRVFTGQIEATDPDTGDTVVVMPGETLGWQRDGQLNPEWKLPQLDDSEQAAQLDAFGVRATESEVDADEPTS